MSVAHATLALIAILGTFPTVALLTIGMWLRRSQRAVLSRLDGLELSFSHSLAVRPFEYEGRIRNSLPSDAVLSYGNPETNIDVRLCPLPPPIELRTVQLPEVSKQGVSDFLLEAAALLGEATEIKTLAVRFSPEVANQLRNGQLELMRSALSHKACAIDPHNGHRIVQLGDIVSSFNPMAATAFAWQVMAFITAQKFLSDVNSKLAVIGNQINEIRSFLISQQESSLVANHDYLKQIATSVSEGNLGFEDVVIIGSQLEDIERQTCTTMHVALKAICSITEEMKRKHDSKWMPSGLEECIAYQRSQAESVARMSHMLLSSLAVRGSAIYLRAILPLNKAIANNRLMLIRDALALYSSAVESFCSRVYSLNETLSVVRVSPVEPKAFVERGRQELESIMRPLEDVREQVAIGIRSIAEALNQTPAPPLLYAQVSGADVALFSTAQ